MEWLSNGTDAAVLYNSFCTRPVDCFRIRLVGVLFSSKLETHNNWCRRSIADCGIVTIQTYQGIAAGLFGKEFNISVEHTRNLNHGDECCEVVISRSDTSKMR